MILYHWKIYYTREKDEIMRLRDMNKTLISVLREWYVVDRLMSVLREWYVVDHELNSERAWRIQQKYRLFHVLPSEKLRTCQIQVPRQHAYVTIRWFFFLPGLLLMTCLVNLVSYHRQIYVFTNLINLNKILPQYLD
jgi:hypothetical protein